MHLHIHTAEQRHKHHVIIERKVYNFGTDGLLPHGRDLTGVLYQYSISIFGKKVK